MLDYVFKEEIGKFYTTLKLTRGYKNEEDSVGEEEEMRGLDKSFSSDDLEKEFQFDGPIESIDDIVGPEKP